MNYSLCCAMLQETIKVCYNQLLIATGARCRGINVTRAAADFPSKCKYLHKTDHCILTAALIFAAVQ
jgi:hypothetical protein